MSANELYQSALLQALTVVDKKIMKKMNHNDSFNDFFDTLKEMLTYFGVAILRAENKQKKYIFFSTVLKAADTSLSIATFWVLLHYLLLALKY